MKRPLSSNSSAQPEVHVVFVHGRVHRERMNRIHTTARAPDRKKKKEKKHRKTGNMGPERKDLLVVSTYRVLHDPIHTCCDVFFIFPRPPNLQQPSAMALCLPVDVPPVLTPHLGGWSVAWQARRCAARQLWPAETEPRSRVPPCRTQLGPSRPASATTPEKIARLLQHGQTPPTSYFSGRIHSAQRISHARDWMMTVTERTTTAASAHKAFPSQSRKPNSHLHREAQGQTPGSQQTPRLPD